MRDKLSQKIKKREPYRPVASIVASEFTDKFFDFRPGGSPHMTFSPKVKEITKKLAPAIVHFDGSSRVQTMTESDNPVLHRVLVKIGEITGAPLLMNSSFNVMNEPIIDTPEDAFRNFFNSEADVLYINGKRYEK
jgi:carbamoyltransferase